MSFKIPTSEEILEISPTSNLKVVIRDSKCWYVKTSSDILRPYLGYLLGRSICNIAETSLLSNEEVTELKTLLSLPIDSCITNTFLVRIASSHKLEELPCQTIEKAVATELVYSVWIRRRDTHADNREYITAGIPVFYDFHIAFLAENNWIHSTLFFKDSPDYGHPPSWRVKEVSETITTERARNVITPGNKAWHYVNSIENFRQELAFAEESVKRLAESDIYSVVTSAGFNNQWAGIITDFLKRNLITLNSDVEEMKKIIFQ
ncbi:MAG: hypothetical protein AAB486_02940 [Patescibacteria group bacterium]